MAPTNRIPTPRIQPTYMPSAANVYSHRNHSPADGSPSYTAPVARIKTNYIDSTAHFPRSSSILTGVTSSFPIAAGDARGKRAEMPQPRVLGRSDSEQSVDRSYFRGTMAVTSISISIPGHAN
jgi:hypothetical protein